MHVAALRAVRGSGGSRVGLPRISSSSSFLLLPPALALLFWPSRPPRRGAPRHSHKARASPCDVPDVEPPSAAPWIATTAAARWFVVWILHEAQKNKNGKRRFGRAVRARASPCTFALWTMQNCAAARARVRARGGPLLHCPEYKSAAGDPHACFFLCVYITWFF